MLTITFKDNYTGRTLRLTGKLLEVLQCKDGGRIQGAYLDLFIPESVRPAAQRMILEISRFLDAAEGDTFQSNEERRCAARKGNAKYHARRAKQEAQAAAAAATPAPQLTAANFGVDASLSGRPAAEVPA